MSKTEGEEFLDLGLVNFADGSFVNELGGGVVGEELGDGTGGSVVFEDGVAGSVAFGFGVGGDLSVESLGGEIFGDGARGDVGDGV